MKNRERRNKKTLFAVLSIAVIVAILSILLVAFAERQPLDDSQDIDDAIAQGKTQLFQQSVSGALSAYLTFTSANSDYYASAGNAQKIKIRTYLALTRMLDVAFRNDGGGLDTLTELLEAYGIHRTGNALKDLKFTEPLNGQDKIILPASAPSGEAFRSFLAGPFLTAINASLSDLNDVIALCPASGEGVDKEIISKTLFDPDDLMQKDVEMDAGDYYLFRSALKFLKGWVLLNAANDMDVSIREIVALANAGAPMDMIKIILDRYPELLKIRQGSGAAQLNEARTVLIDAVNDYETASTKIRGDSDTQAGAEELIAVEQADLQGEVFCREQLALFKTSLQNNTPVVMGGTSEEWLFTFTWPPPSPQNITVILKNSFSEGYISGCTSQFGCNTNLDYTLTDGNQVTFRFRFNGGWSEFKGTLNPEKTQISAGTVSGRSDGAGNFGGGFTAVRQSVENQTLNVNAVSLLGNGTTPPKALRDLLPQLNEFGWPVPGTMGHGLGDDPTLGGILPDYTTQAKWLREFDELFQPAGALTITQVSNGAIVIDAATDDWTGINPVLTDVTGERGAGMLVNGDLEKLYLARDATFLYIRMDLAGNWDATGQRFLYELRFTQSPFGDDAAGDIRLYAKYREGLWKVGMQRWNSNSLNTPQDLSASGGAAAGAGKIVEWRVPLSSLGTIDGRFLSAYAKWWYGYFGEYDRWGSYDDNQTGLQIQPEASITGTMTVPGYNGPGPVYIGVYLNDGSYELNSRRLLRLLSLYPNASNQLPGSYVIDNLSVGTNVIVTALWDQDGNGIVTPGDKAIITQTLTTQAGVNTLNLTLNVNQGSFAPPMFTLAHVYSTSEPAMPFSSAREYVRMTAFLVGPSPEDVTVTVRGPAGQQWVLQPQLFNFSAGRLWYYYDVPSLPDGDYTFEAVDTLGRHAVSRTHHYEYRSGLPRVNYTTMSTWPNFYVGTATPTLSWQPVAGANQYYIVSIFTATGNAVLYLSDPLPAGTTSLTVSAGILQTESQYWWGVSVVDGNVGYINEVKTSSIMNLTSSGPMPFYTGQNQATPQIYWEMITTNNPTTMDPNYNTYVWTFLPGVLFWEVTDYRLKNSNDVSITPAGAVAYYSRLNGVGLFVRKFVTNTPLLPDSYTLEVDLNHNGQQTTLPGVPIAYQFQPTDAVAVGSLTPANNYYSDSLTPTLSWTKVADHDAYYQVLIYEAMGKVELWRSNWTQNNAVDVPQGVLTAGGVYYWTVLTSSDINPATWMWQSTAVVNPTDPALDIALLRFTMNPTFTWSQVEQTVTDTTTVKDQIITVKDQIIADKNQIIAEKDQIIADKDQAIAILNAQIALMFTQAYVNNAVTIERRKWDIDDNSRFSLADVIYALQILSGMRIP